MNPGGCFVGSGDRLGRNCICGLSRDELDQITDNVERTLSHPRGREIFKEFLRLRRYQDNIETVNLYEVCCTVIEQNCLRSRNESSLNLLKDDVAAVKETAEDLDVAPIDKHLLTEFTKALDGGSRTELLSVLENTKDRCREHQRLVHSAFKKYVSTSCPLGGH